MMLIIDKRIYDNFQKWEINPLKSTYCCKEIKSLSIDLQYDEKPVFRLKVEYFDGDYEEEEYFLYKEFNFCPFCGSKIKFKIGEIEEFKKYDCRLCGAPVEYPSLAAHRDEHVKQITNEIIVKNKLDFNKMFSIWEDDQKRSERLLDAKIEND